MAGFRVQEVVVALAVAMMCASCSEGSAHARTAAEDPPAASPAVEGDSCEPAATASAADANEPFDSAVSSTHHVVRFHVPGMICEGCAWQIRETLLGVGGVSRAHTALAGRITVVEYDPAILDSAALTSALTTAGYPPVELVAAP